MTQIQTIQILKRAPWACIPAYLLDWGSRFTGTVPANAASEPEKNFYGDALPQMTIENGIAHMQIFGVMLQNPSFSEVGTGAIAYSTIRGWIAEALAAGVTEIQMEIDSPGGMVIGLAETADDVAAAANKVQVTAFSDSICGSAAYMLAAAAHKIYATGSSLVGSIGAVIQVTDCSKLFAACGIDVHTFVSGPYKAAGNPAVPMSADHAKYFQSFVDAGAGQFKDFVRAQRPRVSDADMQGQIFYGNDALRAGLVDGIVKSRAEVMSSRDDKKPWFEQNPRLTNHAAQYANSPALQREFGSAESFAAYQKAEAAGKVGRIGGGTSTVTGAQTSGGNFEAEWNSSAALQAEFPSAANYAAFRKHQGQVKISSRQRHCYTSKDFSK